MKGKLKEKLKAFFFFRKLKKEHTSPIQINVRKKYHYKRCDNTQYFTQVGQGSDKFLKTLSVQNAVTKKYPALESFGNHIIML